MARDATITAKTNVDCHSLRAAVVEASNLVGLQHALLRNQKSVSYRLCCRTSLTSKEQHASHFHAFLHTFTIQGFALPRKPSLGKGYTIVLACLFFFCSCALASASKTDPRWHLQRIVQKKALNESQQLSGLPEFNLSSIASKPVNIYIVDSGIRISHEEFTGSRASYGLNILNPGSVPTDCDGHGTHVAALAVGAYSGVASAAKAISVRILDCNGNGSCAGILDALEWILEDHSRRGRSGERAVVVMSIGSASAACAPTIRATQALWNSGIVVTAAGGNNRTDTCRLYPARNPGTIAVGAVDVEDRVYKKNNYGDCIDLFGPGVDILSASGSETDSSWRRRTGTSMAAPIIAGIAALILGADSSLSAADVRSIILSSSSRNRILASAENQIMSGTVNRLAFAPWSRLFTEVSMNRASNPSRRLNTSRSVKSGFQLSDPNWNHSASFVALSMTLQPRTSPAMHFAVRRIASAISSTTGIPAASILPRRAARVTLLSDGSEPYNVPLVFYIPMAPSLIGEYMSRLVAADENGQFFAEAKETISFARGSLATAILINVTVPKPEVDEQNPTDYDGDRTNERQESLRAGAKIAIITGCSILGLALTVVVVVFAIVPQIRRSQDRREAVQEARDTENVIVNLSAASTDNTSHGIAAL